MGAFEQNLVTLIEGERIERERVVGWTTDIVAKKKYGIKSL